MIKLLSVTLAAIILAFLCEAQGAVSNKFFHINNQYYPYLEVGFGGVKYSGKKKAATIYDLFIPIFPRSNDKLFFTDLRIFDTSGSEFEGNAHFGYRYLVPQENKGNSRKNINQIVGIYSSFDRIRTDHGNYFNQVTVGGEYWLNKWFLGANVYIPFGSKQRLLAESNSYRIYEKGIGGADAEVGYNFIDNLTLYLGGFYFDTSENGYTSTRGVNGRLEYIFYPASQKRILGIFDDAKLRFSARKANNKGVEGFIELKLRIGISSYRNPSLSSFESHMVDLVRRDSHIITQEYLEIIPSSALVVLESKKSADSKDSERKLLATSSLRKSSSALNNGDLPPPDAPTKKKTDIKADDNNSWLATISPWLTWKTMVMVGGVIVICIGGYELYQHWDKVHGLIYGNVQPPLPPPNPNPIIVENKPFTNKVNFNFESEMQKGSGIIKGRDKIYVVDDGLSVKNRIEIKSLPIDEIEKEPISPFVMQKPFNQEPAVQMVELQESKFPELPKTTGNKEINIFQRARMNLKSNGNLGKLVGDKDFHKENLAGQGGFDYDPNSELKSLGNTFVGQNQRRDYKN